MEMRRARTEFAVYGFDGAGSGGRFGHRLVRHIRYRASASPARKQAECRTAGATSTHGRLRSRPELAEAFARHRRDAHRLDVGIGCRGLGGKPRQGVGISARRDRAASWCDTVDLPVFARSPQDEHRAAALLGQGLYLSDAAAPFGVRRRQERQRDRGMAAA